MLAVEEFKYEAKKPLPPTPKIDKDKLDKLTFVGTRVTTAYGFRYSFQTPQAFSTLTEYANCASPEHIFGGTFMSFTGQSLETEAASESDSGSES